MLKKEAFQSITACINDWRDMPKILCSEHKHRNSFKNRTFNGFRQYRYLYFLKTAKRNLLDNWKQSLHLFEIFIKMFYNLMLLLLAYLLFWSKFATQNLDPGKFKGWKAYSLCVFEWFFFHNYWTFFNIALGFL